MTRTNWSREELIVAFNLYCKMQFGQYHSRHPRVIQLAKIIGRTPGAVAMKLCNFASFDPTHQRRGIKGLSNAGKADQATWDEFNGNWTDLAAESERAYRTLIDVAEITNTIEAPGLEAPDEASTTEETQTERTVKVRLGQTFFWDVVLAAYNNRCCICDLPCPGMLNAGHIIPWAERPDLRVNPRNGLALCSLHDRAFDRGLISVDASIALLLSPQLEEFLPHRVIDDMFIRFRGEAIKPPEKFGPRLEFFEFHRTTIFQAAS
jgi:putative restriction endonuclease